MVDALEAVGHDVRAAASGTEGIEVVKQKTFDLVITDLRLPGADGLTVMKAAKEQSPHVEVVVITAHGSVETAVGAMKLGAFDYITKPFQMEELLLIVERVGRVIRLRCEDRDFQEKPDDTFTFGGMLGVGSRMQGVLDKVKTIAEADSPVLITGESGTGKDAVANAIHQNSPRRQYPMVKVSCASLSEKRLDAELFGYEKGAFPDAMRLRRGRLELANRGTLFLDEIAASSPGIQAKLLRVLQSGKFERLGGKQILETDVRLVCATQRDLQHEVAEERFNADLLFLLNGVSLMLPPLRKRAEDIMVIADHLLKLNAVKAGKVIEGFSLGAKDLLTRYSFPGNIRELERMVERSVAMVGDGETIQPFDLCGHQSCPFAGGTPNEACEFCKEGLSSVASTDRSMNSLADAREEFEKRYIASVVEQAGGNRAAASKILKLSHKALSEKCKRYGISFSDEDQDLKG
ncbi:Sigma-54 dependent transcriptional regulator [Nitrospira sp. KM1]|nr:Sigma-54 dependent transcriptional regulator [Nitrospira sp. KM1]